MNEHDTDAVSMPRELAERVYEHLNEATDEGLPGGEWKSEKLKRDINAIIDLLGLPETDKWY